MFDIGWSELLVVAAIALLVIGPKELPATLRTLGQWAARVRRMAAEFQDQFREAMREADVADLKKDFDSMKEEASLSFAAVGNIKNEIESSFTEAQQAASLEAPAATEEPPVTSEPAETVSAPAEIEQGEQSLAEAASLPAPTEEAEVSAEQLSAPPEPTPAVAEAEPDSDGKQPA